MRAIDAAELLRARMDVHEGHLRSGDVDQRVALRGQLAEPSADHEDEIGRLDPREEFRIGRDPEIARVTRVKRIEEVRAAERRRNRQRETFGKARNRGMRFGGPAAAAEQHDRSLRGPEQRVQLRDLHRAGRGLDRLEARRGRRVDALGEHVFRQRDHDRAGPPARRHIKGARNQFGHASGIVDLDHPFRHAAEETAEVDLLEGVALARVAADLADEQQHRRGILLRDVDAGRGIARARPAGDEAHARTSGRLADRFRHHRGAAFLPADGDLDGTIVERVEHGEIALARHAEHVLDAVDDELIDQRFGGGALIGLRAHARLKSWRETFVRGCDRAAVSA